MFYVLCIMYYRLDVLYYSFYMSVRVDRCPWCCIAASAPSVARTIDFGHRATGRFDHAASRIRRDFHAGVLCRVVVEGYVSNVLANQYCCACRVRACSLHPDAKSEMVFTIKPGPKP